MTTAVANPPAGGDQTQASTNDNNANDVLRDKPWCVTTNDGESVGVKERFGAKAAAEAFAKALAPTLPARIEVRVVDETAIKGGLVDLVAEVEAAKVAAFEEPADN